MTVVPSIDLSGWLTEQLGQASPDLLRQMITTFVQALMGAEADTMCGAGYGERIAERVNSRNGDRHRDFRHPGRHPGHGDPEAAFRVVLPGLFAGAAHTRRAGAHHGGRDELPAGCVDTPDGEAHASGERSQQVDLNCGRGGARVGRRIRCRSSRARSLNQISGHLGHTVGAM